MGRGGHAGMYDGGRSPHMVPGFNVAGAASGGYMEVSGGHEAFFDAAAPPPRAQLLDPVANTIGQGQAHAHGHNHPEAYGAVPPEAGHSQHHAVPPQPLLPALLPPAHVVVSGASPPAARRKVPKGKAEETGAGKHGGGKRSGKGKRPASPPKRKSPASSRQRRSRRSRIGPAEDDSDDSAGEGRGALSGRRNRRGSGAGGFFDWADRQEAATPEGQRRRLSAWGGEVRSRGQDSESILRRLCRGPCVSELRTYCPHKVPCRRHFYDLVTEGRWISRDAGEDKTFIPNTHLDRVHGIRLPPWEEHACVRNPITRINDRAWSKLIRTSNYIHGFRTVQEALMMERYGDWMTKRPPSYILAFFIKHGGFSKFQNAVGVSIDLEEIFGPNEAEGTFNAKFRMSISWFDPFFAHPQWENVHNKEVTSYCAPKIKIKDVVHGDIGWCEHGGIAKAILRTTRATPLGVLTKTLLLSTTIRDDNPIQNFPFDDQELQIELLMPESCNELDHDFQRFFLPINVSVDNA